MITFSRYLIEAVFNIDKPWSVTDVGSVDDIRKALHDNCSASLAKLKKGRCLWKGIEPGSLKNGAIVDSSVGRRRSRATNNMYQTLMDMSPYLQDYPSRSTSMICTTSYTTAEVYGQAMAIVPFDGVDIAVGGAKDFIYKPMNLGNGSISVEELGIVIVKTLRYFMDIRGEFNIASIDSNLKKIEYADFKQTLKLELSGSSTGNVLSSIESVLKNGISMESLSRLFTPETLGLRLIQAGKLPASSNTECWFSGKCVVFDRGVYFQLMGNNLDKF